MWTKPLKILCFMSPRRLNYVRFSKIRSKNRMLAFCRIKINEYKAYFNKIVWKIYNNTFFKLPQLFLRIEKKCNASHFLQGTALKNEPKNSNSDAF